MAVGTGIGFNLDELDKAFKAADKSMERLLQRSGKFKEDMVRNFLEIGSRGVDPFLSKLREQQTALEWLANVKLDGASKQFESLQKDAAKALDSTNKLVEGFEKIARASATYNASAGLHDLKIIDDQIRAKERAAEKEAKERATAYAQREKELNDLFNKEVAADEKTYQRWLELKEKERATNEAVEREKHNRAVQNIGRQNAEYQKGEDARYQAWLKNKDAESRKEQSDADAKWQRQKNNIYQQNAQLAAEELRQKQKNAEEERRIAKQLSDERIEQAVIEARRRIENEKLIRAEQKMVHDQRQRELEELFREQERQAKAQAKYDSISRRERYNAYTTSYEGAIRTSDKAKTLAQEIQAVKNLEAARAKLNKTSADYDKKLANINNRIKKHNENIDKATKGAKKLREEHQSLGQAAGGLGRMLASAFSIQAIRGYINQMIKVRGEFELQQRSLQAILQNKDAADELWQKTIDLAVRSPFRVKELVTYTKQLAAYRIESDKLFETNKMLADVSAGLGVDMSRLILAFGQVRSASFLRGTELRQFTEAGIPMLEELAKYFTELEGRAVSVGDVFERISKRMVSFADVEEVFKRITSEGGTFYRMQEIQAETLRGQISNLKDSVDIMLNDMGKSYDSTLKNMVSLTKSLVDNWRTVSSIAIPIVGALVARWGIFKIATTKNAEAIAGFAKTFGRHFGVVITQLTRGTRVAKQFAKSTQVSIMGGWTTVILAVVAALTILVKTIQNANRVKRELEKIDLSGAFDASRSVAEYKRLANVVSDTSKSYDEQQKALSTLKAKYQDILPSHLLEQDTIKALKGNYEEATTAIYDYIAAKTKEKQIEVIQTEYGSDVEEQAGDLADDIKKALAKVAPNITRSDVLPIVNKLQELIQLGDVNVLNVDEVIQNLVRQFTGLEISADAWKYTFSAMNGEMVTLENNAESFVIAMGKMKQAMNEITSSSLSWQDSFIYQDFNRVKEGYEEQSAAIGKYYETIRKYEQEREERGESEVADELKRDYEVAVESLNKIFDEANQKAPEWSTIINEPFKLNEATINANKILWQKMIGEINTMPIVPNQVGAKQNYVELLEEQMEGFAGTKKQQEVARVAQDLANTMRVSLEGLDELFLKSDESLSDYAKRISGTLEQYKTGILQFDTDIQNGTKFGDYTKDQVDLMRSQVPLLEEFLKLFAAFLAPKKSTTTEDTFTPMLRSVKEIYSEFKKLQGSFDDLTAKEGALAKFGDAFKEAFGKTPEQMGFDLFSEEGVKAAYDYLISKAPDAKKKIQAQLAKGEIVWDVKLQKKKDTDQELVDSVQELFDQYDISLELKKLNIPKDLAKSLFNVDYLDLDGLRKAVEAKEVEFIGTDMEKEYEDFLKKINNLSRKQREDEAKEFVNFLKKNLNEIQVIQDKGAYNIALADRLFGKGKITVEQYMSSIRQIVEDTNKEVAKVNLEKFKDSATYIKAMGNLAAYSRDELEEMMSALQGQVGANAGNMGADEIRAYYEALERLVGQYDKIESPFQKGEINDLIEYLNLQKQLNQEKEKEAALEQRKAEINARLELLQNKLASQQASGDTEGAKFTQGLIKSAVNELKEVDGQIVSVASNILVISERVEALGDGMVKSLAVAHKIVNEIANVANAATKIFDDVKSAADALGADTESGGWAKAGYAMEMVGGVSSELTQGLANFASGNFAGALANVVGMVTKLVSGFAKIHDQKYQDIIEAQAEQVERLGKAYAKLEVEIGKAFSIRQLQEANAELEKNIELQIAAYEAMIAAERAKKNTDEDQIAAWNEELKALTQQWKELKQSLVEGVGGISDYRSQTREFVDAWVSAFQETGNGLEGLKNNFREFFDNIIAEQAALRVTEEFLAPFYDKLNAALNDLELSVDESKALREEADKIMPELSNALELIWTQLGGSTGNAEGAGLSALQKGVQGITEDTAQVIEAYLNSIRGYVSEQVTHTRNIYRILNDAVHSDAAAIRVRMV